MSQKWKIYETQKGRRLGDPQGFLYQRDRQIGNKSFWKCDWKFNNCKAYISLIGDLSNPSEKQTISGNIKHNHAPPSMTIRPSKFF